ncbi:MAG: hypothetical protein ACT4PT_03310 [Methanobacteriota archaeon]
MPSTSRAMLLAVLMVGLAGAGCIGRSSEGPPTAATSLFAAAPFGLEGAECVEAGFIAAYNGRRAFADAWESADVREELGNPVHDAVGRPVTGPLNGNWHMGFRCASVSSTGGEASDFVFGYVGQMVERPVWDTGGADLHFLMSGFGFANGTIADDLRAKTTADVTPAVELRIDWFVPKENPRSAAYVVYVDGEKGVYESWSDLMLLRDVPERTIRLWWQVPTDGSVDHHAHHNQVGLGNEEDQEGSWHPVHWDVHVSAGTQYITPPQDGVQFGSHNMFQFEHGPVAAQPTTTGVYFYDWVAVSSGSVHEDVTLTKMWNH